MSSWSFETLPAWAMACSLAAHLAAGIGLGILYFTAVWWNARFLASGARAGATVVLTAGRFALLGGVLALAGLEGALPLLALALGVRIARPLVMRKLREVSP